MYEQQIQHTAPPVAMPVDIESVLLTVDTACLVHPTVHPVYLTSVTIHTYQFTIVGHHQQLVTILRYGRDTKAGIQLLVGIAQFDGGDLLVIGMVDIHRLLKVLHPDILLRVDMQPLHIAVLETQLGQFPGSLTFKTLRHRVVDAVVHTLSHPQFPVGSLKHTIRIVITHRGGITQIRIVGLHAIAVIAVQTVGGAYPHIPLRVFEYIVNLRTRQTVRSIESPELHIGNHRRLRLCHHAEHRQTKNHQFSHFHLYYSLSSMITASSITSSSSVSSEGVSAEGCSSFFP